MVYSAFRAGSNTHTFALGDWEEEAAQPLVERREPGLTSAGLDGEEAPSGMSE